MAEKVTPMMRQYRRIKAELAPDVILFFRLGDFYEMFFEDAQEAAPILDIALTCRNDVPMCGVPHHAVDLYLSRMIRAGRKVAICDQVEDAAEAKGIVRREVTRVVTPGTVIEDAILESKQHNFLASLYGCDDAYAVSFLDLSTGSFLAEEADSAVELRESLLRAAPVECIVPADRKDDPVLRQVIASLPGTQVNEVDGWSFGYDAARDYLVRTMDVHSLEGFGCEGNAAVVGAAGAALFYVKEELRRDVSHIGRLRVSRASSAMQLDETTCGNLDLVPRRGAPDRGSTVLGVLDDTCTAMGARLLRDWLVRPSCLRPEIEARHEAVAELHGTRPLLAELREGLGQVRDLERLVTRIGSGTGNARDVSAVGHSLRLVPAVKEVASQFHSERLRTLGNELDPRVELTCRIGVAIADEPPVTLKEGGIIREGYNEELDALRQAATEGRQWLAQYQLSEQERTGIKNLKVRHNKVFGYYIEVSKAQLANVPEEYTRKQTLVNAERFITPELKEYEARVLGAHDKAVALEYELFQEVREAVVGETRSIQHSAEALAQLDVLACLAGRALALRYVRPMLTDADTIRVQGGRHPVVEQMPDAERFVPNDVLLNGSDHQILIITGPNMAGKSTYIRQVAVIVVMAQMGGFVPADEAEIGIVDRVFTRVGASDDLARGRSTFMVEMQETANILNNATARSLVVLDEIGRGTSTFDGISIAWAVAEFLHTQERVKARTLFATHYHELVDLEMTLPGVKNYNIQVREKGDRVVFLRRIVRGGADKSYGIQVARLAGMPDDVIDRAREILGNLEEGEFGETGQPKLARRRKGGRDRNDPAQMDLFG